jgi:ribosome biogenesis protein SSF1/2
MAGPLGVTHLFLFSRSKTGNTNLRIALTPRGPTLHFQVEKYSLCKDIAKSQKRPKSGGKEYTSPPLLVMNNFISHSSEPDSDPIKKQLESLTTTIFQSMFPPISPQTTSLSSIKRIMLLNREIGQEGTYVLSLRHYAITTKRTGISKRVRRLDAAEQRLREKKSGALPNLGKLEDVADYLLDPAAGGYTSASETELDTDAEVEVLETSARKVLNKRDFQKMRDSDQKPKNSEHRNNVEKRAVKLVELGPRMRLRMVKVEEGLCEGRVMWNEFVTKTKAEEKELEQVWDRRRKEKEERKRVQKENVQKKRQLRANTKANSGTNGLGAVDAGESEEEEWDSDDSGDEAEDEPQNVVDAMEE